MSKFPSNNSFTRIGRVSAALATIVLSLGLMGGARPPMMSPVAADEMIPKQSAPAQAELAEFAVEPSDAAASTELLHTVTQETAPAAIDAKTSDAVSFAHTRTIWVQVTAYCSCKKCCGPLARGITASGRSIQYNGGLFVAADTKLFPFGTKLIVPGYADDQPVEVIDRGGAIKGHHIDVFFPTHEQARQWGVRWMQITVVD